MGSYLSSVLGRGKMANKVDTDSQCDISSGIYHEKQQRELCAIHSINNILQQKAFVQKDFDKLCQELSPSRFFNPHRSMFGTGNYDINVIMAALLLKGQEVIWFDKRKSVEELRFENINGFILNIPSDYKLGGLIPFNLNHRHWVAVKRVGDAYYNLDSKLKTPDKIHSLGQFLKNQLLDKDRELLIVVSQEVQESSSWKTADHS